MELNIEKQELKNKMFWVRVTPVIYEKISKLSKKYNVDRSVVVRELIKKGLKE